MPVTDETEINIGSPVYYSTEPLSTVSSVIDWRITDCTAADGVTPILTAGGATFALIKDTVCTSDIVQVGFGDENGDFSFNAFLLNNDSNVLDIICNVKLCFRSDNCFQEVVDECDEQFTKNE